MNLIKVKFLRNGEPSGRAYTYDSPVEVNVGDTVQINDESKGVVIEINVPESEIAAFGADKLKSIIGLSTADEAQNTSENSQIDVVATSQLGSIDFNYEDIKTLVEAKMSEYKGVVYDDNSISIAKSDRAYLNKLVKTIDDKRKEIKSEFNKPLKEFEDKVKSILELIKEPIALIDEQIKNFDAAKKDVRLVECKKIYDDTLTLEEKLYLPFERIYRPEWLNVSTSSKSIREEIKTKGIEVTEDIALIKRTSTNKPDVDEALNRYARGCSLRECTLYLTERANMRRELEIQAEKARMQAEIERAREEERKKIMAELAKAEPEPVKEPELVPEQVIMPTIEPIPGPIVDGRLRVEYVIVASQEEIDSLEFYMEMNGIDFTKKEG